MPENGGNGPGKNVATQSTVVAVNNAERSDPLIGQVVDGRYQVQEKLGEGGMGIVFRGVHTTLGKQLAIKVLRPEVSKNEEILARFKQEAQSASAIGNQHIIDISDFGVLPDGATYFVMEFLTGKSLTEALEAGKFETRRTVHIAKQLCNALGAAHEIGVVHRDMKPDNVQLVDRGGGADFVKVLDFGIAKVGGASSKLTQAGQVFGTPHYMSPEQCAGTAVDHRTDIYALGVIMYEMATGQVPFDADNLMGILTKHLYENPIPPREFDPPTDVPPALEAVIMKALSKKPEARYQSMAEMAEDLQAVDSGLTPRAVMEAVDRGTGGVPAGEGFKPSVTVGMPFQEIRIKKSMAPVVLGIGAVVVLGGGAAAVLMSSGGETETAADQNVIAPAPIAAPESESKAAPEPEPEAKPQPAVESEVQVTLTGDPEDAEVYLDDMLVGNTPYSLAKPKKGKTVDLVFRKAGYKDKKVRVSFLTAENTKVTLSKTSSRKPSSRTERKKTTKKQPAAGPSWPGPARRRAPTEVLDPWD